MFQVLILKSRPKDSDEIIFQGQAGSVSLPGSEGEFEVLNFHKPILSRLKKGTIVVDNTKEFPVTGGIVKMASQSLVAIIDG